MDTEQAHSRGTAGRDAVPPWRDLRTAPRAVPTIWLNLVCLDAPIVAVVWLWLFARTFQLPVHLGNTVALFLTAWLIYLADRLLDAASLKVGVPPSLRQEFCLQHREIWISALLLIGGFDLYVICWSTANGTFFAGAVVGILTLLYLVLNHPLGLIWRSLPAKEIAIGLLFTAGMLVALLPAMPLMTPSFPGAALAFASLCALNCISIASWERELDEAQEKTSIATRHPSFTRRASGICAVLALASLASAIAHVAATPIFACISVSALLLGWLNAAADVKEGRFQNRPRRFVNRHSLGIDRDQRTALADLVLLTPLIALIVMAL